MSETITITVDGLDAIDAGMIALDRDIRRNFGKAIRDALEPIARATEGDMAAGPVGLSGVAATPRWQQMKTGYTAGRTVGGYIAQRARRAGGTGRHNFAVVTQYDVLVPNFERGRAGFDEGIAGYVREDLGKFGLD